MARSEEHYDKTDIYISSLYNVFKMVYKKSEKQKDQRMKAIALTIYNYLVKKSKDNGIKLNDDDETDTINLIPFFEYVSFYNIEFYDFNNISMEDLDITSEKDLERFVLTHIYYITQKPV